MPYEQENKKTKIVTTVYLEVDLLEKIETVAEQKQWSKNKVICNILEDYFKQENK